MRGQHEGHGAGQRLDLTAGPYLQSFMPVMAAVLQKKYGLACLARPNVVIDDVL